MSNAKSNAITFSAEEIECCKAAMSKPAPLDALRLIASGRVVVELSPDRRDLYLDSLDGRPIRDDGNGLKMGLSGAWPLFRAGMINEFCLITPAGLAVLEQSKTLKSKDR